MEDKALADGIALLKKLQPAVLEGHPSAKGYLAELKVLLTQLSSLPPCSVPSANAVKELSLAREGLEWGALYSVKTDDMAGFERDVTQLKVLYSDFSDQLQPSKMRCPVMGMRLLHLLVENRMAEFHGELETLSHVEQEDQHIAFAINLEQYLMEGSYSKVLEARSHVPNEIFRPFMNELLSTVRVAISDCSEVAYQSISLEDAQRMLIFDSAAELKSYVTAERPEWMIRGNRIVFKLADKHLTSLDIPSLRLVEETLTYATELDRIV